MTKFLIKFLSFPFVLLGFVWQFIAGSFYAGRIWSTVWIRSTAVAVRDEYEQSTPAAKPRKDIGGLH